MLASGFVLIRWRRSALMPARSLIAVALLGLLCTADAVAGRGESQTRPARHGAIGHRDTETRRKPKDSPCLSVSVAHFSVSRSQARKVQVGYCSTLKNIDAAKAAGFDYVELGTSEIAALSDDEYEKAVTHIKQVGLPVPVTNLFLPAALKVTGPQTDRDQQMAYVKKAFARLSRLGTEIVVFGSGGARRVPEGFSKEDAFKQLVEFGKRIAPE